MRASTSDRLTLARGFAEAAARYWLAVHPQIRGELAHWRCCTRLIADPVQRCLALGTLISKQGNLEGAAAFATFAPAARRGLVVRASIAFQALYDFADTRAEQPGIPDPDRARRLHSGLLAALPRPRENRHDDPHNERDTYMTSLVEACRGALVELPSFQTVYERVEINTRRIVKYQTLIDHPTAFAAWATAETPAGSGLRWWETGAACGSSAAIFALIAAAASPGLRLDEAAAIERAYFPWVGALHTLLDSLIDQPEDLAGGQHSLIAHYGSSAAAAARMGRIATEAARLAGALAANQGHRLVLAGMTSQYASSPRALLPHALPARATALGAMGELAAPTLAVFAIRRKLARATQRVAALSHREVYAHSGLFGLLGSRQDRPRDGTTCVMRAVEADGQKADPVDPGDQGCSLHPGRREPRPPTTIAAQQAGRSVASRRPLHSDSPPASQHCPLFSSRVSSV